LLARAKFEMLLDAVEKKKPSKSGNMTSLNITFHIFA